MSSLDELKVVNRSLDSFKALRDGIGYLRSISVCFEPDEESQSRLSSLMAAHAMAADGRSTLVRLISCRAPISG